MRETGYQAKDTLKELGEMWVIDTELLLKLLSACTGISGKCQQIKETLKVTASNKISNRSPVIYKTLKSIKTVIKFSR